MVDRIFYLMEKSGISRKKLAEIIGKSVNTISEWKSGRQQPTVEQIIALAEYFDVTTDYILLGKEKSHNTVNGIVGNSNVGNSIHVNDEHLDKVELEIISAFRKLSLSEKANFISELCKKGE